MMSSKPQLLAQTVSVAVFALLGAGCAGPTPAADDQPHSPAAADSASTKASANPSGAELPDVELAYDSFVLDNGLTVIVHQDHKVPVVAVNVWYHVGSKMEHPGKTGFAHIFEHLMFQGSENYDGEFFEPLEKAGATDMNGTTNNDRTNYFETVPTPALDLALWMESDRMGHFAGAISQARLDEQRGVVQNEKRQGENSPYGKARELIPENTYPAGHPYSWSVIGSIPDLQAASLDDVKSWFATYYGPSNAVLALAGDITVDQAKQKAQTYFGDISPGPAVSHRGPWVAKMDERKELTTYDQVAQARVYYVYNVPQYGSDTTEYLRLAARLLGTGKTSRLYKRLVYDDELATDVDVDVGDGEIGSQLYIKADARDGVDLDELEAAIEQELAEFRADGPTPAELRRAKMSAFAGTLSSLEKVGGFGGKSDRLARGQTYLGDPGAFERLLDVRRRASADQIRQAADHWLSDGVFVLRVRPDPNYAADDTHAADRSRVPKPGDAPRLDLPELRRTTLSNGVEVVVAERHDIPKIRLQWMARAGFADDPADKSGLASLTMDVLDEGTDTYGPLELAGRLDELGATLSSNAGLAMSTVSLNTLKTSLDPALSLFGDVLLHPAFSSAQIKRRRKQLVAKIAREKARPFAQALRLLGPLVYGNGHMYGVPLTGSGSAEAVAKLDRTDLVGYHARHIRPDNATIVVVGDTTLEAIEPKLEAQFGDWQPDPAAPSSDTPASGATGRSTTTAATSNPASSDSSNPTRTSGDASNQPKIFLIDKPDAGQSLVVTGNTFAPRAQTNQLAAQAMNAAIGGVFSSRLNMNLREKRHWSYGARSFLYETPGQQLFGTYANVQRDKTAASMRQINQELAGYVGKHPITAAELAKATANKTRKLAGQNETTGRLLAHIADIITYDLADDYWDTYTGRMQQLGLDEVRQTARQTVKPTGSTWVVIGDLDRIEADVRDLNLGQVVVLGAEDDQKP